MKTLFLSCLATICLFCALNPVQTIAQPSGCAALGVNPEPTDFGCYRVYYNNQAPDCFSQITFYLNEGYFSNWTANSSGGWTVTWLSDTELLLTHDSGLIPSGPGYFADLCIGGVDSTSLFAQYDDSCPPGEGCISWFPVVGAPDPSDASIIGYKYKECGTLPFTNQTPIAGWTMQLLDADGNILGEQVTNAAGAYAFTDLPAGQYIVKEETKPGWTASVPSSGQIAVSLNPSQQKNANFGNCPPVPPPCACPSGTQPGAANYVQNGDFSSSGGFSSGYTLNNNNPPLQPGQYWIGSNPGTINPGFALCNDHSGGGNMLVANGASNPNTPVWSQTISVAPNSNYIFEGWAASLSGASPANLSLFVLVNSQNVQYEVGRIFLPSTTCDWQRWCQSWQTGNYTSITLSIYDLNPTAAGNDFALDDLSFRRCQNPLPQVSGVLYAACDSLPYSSQPVLGGWTVQLLDTLGNVLNETVTDSAGAYSFIPCCLGIYVIKAASQPDWTPTAPTLGIALVDISAGDDVVQNFSFCKLPVLPCSCPVPYSPIGNLVTDPGFSSSGGFGSAYAQNTGNPPLLSGQYWVGNNPKMINNSFQACTDHPSGSGNMLVVYGTPGSGTVTQPAWTNTYTVAQNTYYIFSAWTAPVLSGTFPFAGLELTANGQSIAGLTYDTPVQPCTWKRICGLWYSGSVNSVTLNINSVFFNWSLPAVAIDDISFSTCSINVIPPLGSVLGTVHRSCDTLPDPDQPVLADWAVQLLDTLGNVLNETVTDSAGAYAFADLPFGVYWVKTVAQPGWTPSSPPDGQALVQVDSGGSVVQNFSFCPTCSCDSIEIVPYQVQSPSDTGLYQLSVSNQSPYCFSHVEIQLGAVGEIVGWDSLAPGWSVELVNSKLLRLQWAEPQLPAGSYLPLLLKINGTGEQEITTTTYWNDGSGDVACARVFQNPVPTPQDDCCINPGANNLIPNGNFSGGNTGFSSDYGSDCSNALPGYYCVTANPGNVNGNFTACSDYTTGSGPMLVANGSFLSSKRVWYRTVPVTPNTNYKFVFHYTALNSNHMPTLGVSINYAINITTNGIIGGVCDWWGMCVVTWNSGSNTSATLAIKDLTTNANGNDFALDDMWFFPCPLPCQSSFTATPLDNCGKYQFTNTSANPPANVQYCWDFDNNPATCESTAASPMWQFPTCGTYNVTLKLTGSNCSSSANQTITITDNMPPTAVCLPGAGYDMGNNCTLNVTPGMIDGGSTDNCQIVSTSVSPTQIPCGFSLITLTVTDWCGNSSTCTTTIQAAEGVAPTALCQPAMAIDVGTDCSLQVTPNMLNAGSYDNCGIDSYDVSPEIITCGTTTVTLIVTDDCGNTGTCTTDIQIGEGQPPAITCPFGISANCNLNVGPDVAGTPTATDNCTAAIKIEYTYSDVVFGMPGCDDHIERTWVAEDLCGNTSSCVQLISVKDNIPPSIDNCPQSQTVGMDPGQCHYTYTPSSLSVSDNCDPSPSLSCLWEEPSGTITPLVAGVQMPKGSNTIRCKATDDCGNESPLCIYNIVVTDTEQPVLTCPPNVTVQGNYNPAGQCEAVVGNLAPVATDNCPLVSLDYLVSPSGASGQNDASGTLFDGISTLSYTAMDCGGFVKTCSTVVTVSCQPCTPGPGAACADAVNTTVQCIPSVFGQYDLSLQVLNQSGFQADRIELTSVTPFGGITQTLFNLNLPNGATSGPIATQLNGVPGSTVCFKISLYRTAPNGVVLECCESSQTVCLTLPECPGPCNCAGADNLNFTYTGYPTSLSWPAPVPATCGNTTPVILPCVPEGETPFAFHGVAHCDAADCVFSNFYWEITDPNGMVVLPGGPVTFSAIVGPDAYFDIYNLSSNNLTSGVTYTLTVKWFCGGKICTCAVKFQLTECDCHCVSPVSNVVISSGALYLSAPCGNTLFQGIPCPPAGTSVNVTGKFQCVGSECLPGKIVKYTLTGPNGPVTSGAVLATPFFSISLLPQQMYAVGQYTLTMTGECNGQPCTPCFFKFFHQCPEPCPCPDATFNTRVDQGFTVVSSGTACKACFTPKNLGPCEKVEWYVNGAGPFGSPTMGNAPFCHTFSSTNTYQIRMDVTRYKTDGTICAMRSKTQFVKILCDPSSSPCSADVVSNPGFDQGAATGGLNSGGASSGWQGAYGDPVVMEGFGATDGWSVMLSGNRDSADVLSLTTEGCWVKDTGTITLRAQDWGGVHDANRSRLPGETLRLRLYRGGIPNPFTDSCDGSNCLELVEWLQEAPDSGWYYLDIPYNLSGWAATDSCGDPLPDPPGVLVRPVLYLTNWLGQESGSADETHSMILIDNFCIDGQVLVGEESPSVKNSFRIYPNPNDGNFTIELSDPAAPGTRFRVVGLAGSVVWEKTAEPGHILQNVQTGDLPAGLYFIQVVSEGSVTAIVKFVKQ